MKMLVCRGLKDQAVFFQEIFLPYHGRRGGKGGGGGGGNWGQPAWSKIKLAHRTSQNVLWRNNFKYFLEVFCEM